MIFGLTTDQTFEIVLGGMGAFWLAFTAFVASRPAPFESKERRALDDLRRINKK